MRKQGLWTKYQKTSFLYAWKLLITMHHPANFIEKRQLFPLQKCIQSRYTEVTFFNVNAETRFHRFCAVSQNDKKTDKPCFRMERLISKT